MKLVGFTMVVMLTLVSATNMFAAASPTTSLKPKDAKNVTAEKASGIITKVTTSKKGTAKVVAVTKTEEKKIVISSKLTVKGVKYKVTTISAKAFSKCSKAQSISLPSSITTIEKYAFSNLASSVKTITFNNSKSITVKKGAFTDTDTKKMTIKVSANMSKNEYKKFVKTLKSAGFKGTIKQLTKS